MTVGELIGKLQECNPDALVEAGPHPTDDDREAMVWQVTNDGLRVYLRLDWSA